MQTVDASIQIPMDWLVREIAKQVPVDRHRAMVERIGEACTKTTAAKEISCSTQTITKMVADGRLKSACEGTRIDVRSLADLIERRSEPKKQLWRGKKNAKM